MPRIATLVSCLLLTAGTHATDWPCFQGPDRNGVVHDTNWFPSGADEPLWSATVGMGYSCPSIVNGRLVTMGFRGFQPEEGSQSEDLASGQDHVVCLDATSGEEIWRYAYESTNSPNYHTGGTLTTPAIHDGVVYVANREGKVHALSLDRGTVLWSRDYRTELQLEETFHGYCASPLVLGERIVFVFGGMAAAAKRDGGEILWTTRDHGDGSYSNPAPLMLGDTECVAAMLAQTFFVFEVETGAVRHEMAWKLHGNSVHVAAPLVMNDRVFLSTAYNKGCALVRLGEDVEPEILWSSKTMRNKVTGCFLHGEHIYGFDESMLKCIDLEGKEAWRVRGLGMGALSIAGDRLIVLTSKGELIVAEATPDEYRELSRRKVLDGGVYWTMPVLVDGLIYARNSEGAMVCLDHRADRHSAPRTPDSVAQRAPEAAALFEAHAQRVNGQDLRRRAGLRLTGDLEILGRGLARSPATLTLAAPNRWEMRLTEGGMTYAYDGTRGWADEPRGTWLFEGDELREAKILFALYELFAPRCPSGAVVERAPVEYRDVTCWRVTSPRPEHSGTLAHYFEVESGRLVGRDGDGLTALVHEGDLELDGVHLPSRMTCYREGSGQEETFYFASCAWIEPTPDLVSPPPGIVRLLRTPDEIAAAETAIRARFAEYLGRYHVDIEEMSAKEMELRVEKGDLWVSFLDEQDRVELESENDGQFVIQGSGGATIAFEHDERGDFLGIRLRFGDPDAAQSFLLPRIE